MKKEISTQMQRVDWNAIRKNYLDTNIWGDTYTLFEFGDIVVTSCLEFINVASKRLDVMIRVKNTKTDYEVITYAPIMIDDFDPEVFENIVNNKIKYLIRQCGNKLAREDWHDKNDGRVDAERERLSERFNELIESVNFGDMVGYIDIDDLRCDFIDNNCTIAGGDYDYGLDHGDEYVEEELAFFEERVNEMINPQAPSVDFDEEEIEELELDL